MKWWSFEKFVKIAQKRILSANFCIYIELRNFG